MNLCATCIHHKDIRNDRGSVFVMCLRSFSDPNFVKYLRYFIAGPALPAITIEGFRKILIEDSGTSGMVMDQLCKFVRAETRRLRLERAVAREEFWRLAQEVGYLHAATVRDAAGSAGR